MAEEFQPPCEQGGGEIRILAPATYKIKEERDKLDPVTGEVVLDKYNSEKYMILQGYFHDREKNSSQYREVWVQIRSYLFAKEYKQKFLASLKGKDFEGRWMPEGTINLYAVSIGEYPWSGYITQYLKEMQEEQSFRGNL